MQYVKTLFKLCFKNILIKLLLINIFIDTTWVNLMKYLMMFHELTTISSVCEPSETILVILPTLTWKEHETPFQFQVSGK